MSAGASGMAEGKRSARNRHLPTNQWPLPQNALQRVHWTKRVERATTHTWRALSLVSASLDRVPMRAAVCRPCEHVFKCRRRRCHWRPGGGRRRSTAKSAHIHIHRCQVLAVLDVRIKGCIFTLGIAAHLLLLYIHGYLHPAPMAHSPALAACPRSSLSSYGGSAYRPTSQKSVVPCGRCTYTPSTRDFKARPGRRCRSRAVPL